ncbi:sugar-binding transcriptional regulator [Fusibacter sp. A1]|uniref:sugar-binding transcriptional regulator n=2 Tax=Fusibacter TaxID=76008 RepID=UPI0014950BC8|nr:sugar-binding domain-containing protein [Fusibacter sp. A1]
MITFKDSIDQMSRIVPEIKALIPLRYRILYLVSYLQPIGRRNLSLKIGITERIIRKEATVLKEAGFLDFTSEGMILTPDGKYMLDLLADYVEEFDGLRGLETRVATRLGIARVILVPDDDDEGLVLKEIGAHCAQVLFDLLPEVKTLGITGGSTVFEVTKAMPQLSAEHSDIVVVPARGGVGNETEHQANTMAEKMAKKIKCQYEMLFIPDSLSETSIQLLKNEPGIKSTFEKMQQIDTLIFGIGHAEAMAERRGLPEERIKEIVEKGAVAESFGFYFNREGEIVDEISTLGITLEKVKSLTRVIAVAGGKDKSEAIIAVSKLNPHLILITNESVATQILDATKAQESL